MDRGIKTTVVQAFDDPHPDSSPDPVDHRQSRVRRRDSFRAAPTSAIRRVATAFARRLT